jgi:hypothetical protein
VLAPIHVYDTATVRQQGRPRSRADGRLPAPSIAPESRDRAIDPLNRNTAMMVKADGFAPREVYFSTNDANINYCVSTFRSQEHWAAYFKLLNRPKLIFDGSEKRTYSSTAL